MAIRLAVPADAGALLRIYAQYIDTSITFETVLPSEEEFAGRIAAYGAEYPYLVWEEDGRTLGYAYAHRSMERAAYQWNAELSIYLDKDARGRGMGRKLYGMLMDILRLQEIRNVYGVVTAPNPASDRLHEAWGFARVGLHRNTGWKAGQWRDVSWYEKEIAPHGNGEPAPFRPISQVPAEQIGAILAEN